MTNAQHQPAARTPALHYQHYAHPEHWPVMGPDDEPDTLVPELDADEARGLPLDDQLQTLLAGAVALGETHINRQAYLDGYRDGAVTEWRWGVICGAIGISIVYCAAMGLGNLIGLL